MKSSPRELRTHKRTGIALDLQCAGPERPAETEGQNLALLLPVHGAATAVLAIDDADATPQFPDPTSFSNCDTPQLPGIFIGRTHGCCARQTRAAGKYQQANKQHHPRVHGENR